VWSSESYIVSVLYYRISVSYFGRRRVRSVNMGVNCSCIDEFRAKVNDMKFNKHDSVGVQLSAAQHV